MERLSPGVYRGDKGGLVQSKSGGMRIPKTGGVRPPAAKPTPGPGLMPIPGGPSRMPMKPQPGPGLMPIPGGQGGNAPGWSAAIPPNRDPMQRAPTGGISSIATGGPVYRGPANIPGWQPPAAGEAPSLESIDFGKLSPELKGWMDQMKQNRGPEMTGVGIHTLEDRNPANGRLNSYLDMLKANQGGLAGNPRNAIFYR